MSYVPFASFTTRGDTVPVVAFVRLGHAEVSLKIAAVVFVSVLITVKLNHRFPPVGVVISLLVTFAVIGAVIVSVDTVYVFSAEPTATVCIAIVGVGPLLFVVVVVTTC